MANIAVLLVCVCFVSVLSAQDKKHVFISSTVYRTPQISLVFASRSMKKQSMVLPKFCGDVLNLPAHRAKNSVQNTRLIEL